MWTLNTCFLRPPEWAKRFTFSFSFISTTIAAVFLKDELTVFHNDLHFYLRSDHLTVNKCPLEET